MPDAWRIVKEKYAGSAFSGEGAALGGGRWNSRGVRVVYTSNSRALAALETLVHLNPRMIFRYAMFRVSFDAALVEELPHDRLPIGWNAEPPPKFTQHLGDAWVAKGGSAVWQMPSVLVPGEWNYLLNPAHPDFAKVDIGPPEPFGFDPRLTM